MHETEIDITGENVHLHQIIRKKSFSCELPAGQYLVRIRNKPAMQCRGWKKNVLLTWLCCLVEYRNLDADALEAARAFSVEFSLQAESPVQLTLECPFHVFKREEFRIVKGEDYCEHIKQTEETSSDMVEKARKIYEWPKYLVGCVFAMLCFASICTFILLIYRLCMML